MSHVLEDITETNTIVEALLVLVSHVIVMVMNWGVALKMVTFSANAKMGLMVINVKTLKVSNLKKEIGKI